MRRLLLSMSLALVGTACLAQGIPQGSYQQTCNNVSVNGDTLTANCQDTSGNWKSVELPGFQRCGGEIVNDNGVLRCAMNGPVNSLQGNNGPSGSYLRSCQNVHVSGDDLKASCQGRDGAWHDAKLDDYRKCNGDIINDDSKLRCVAGAPVGGVYGGTPSYAGVNGPPGDYVQTCQDIHVGGDDLHARCQTRAGEWHDTKLDDYNKCRGNIVNDDGKLRCVAGGYNPAGYGPSGSTTAGNSYLQSCKDIRSHGDDLDAKCQTRSGDWRKTSLDDYKKCKSDIINDDGRLRCQK